jgi:hypothetical protein
MAWTPKRHAHAIATASLKATLITIGAPIGILMSLLINPPMSAGASPTSRDLLSSLPPPLRSQVLEGASARDLCELQVLEKDFHLRFKPGTTANAPSQLSDLGPCGEGSKTYEVRITNANDLKSSDKRGAWLRSSAGYCEYKKRLKDSLERAAKKLAANPNYGFLKGNEPSQGIFCALSPSAWTIWKPIKNSYCIAASGNSSTALECFYSEACRFECGGGSINLQMLGAYELFAGEDGKMDDQERTLFDRHYPDLSTGPFAWPYSGGIEETSNPFEGAKAKKKRVTLAPQAKLGAYALTGLRIAVDTKDSYKRSYGNHAKDSAELSSNAIIISTSSEAAKAFESAGIEGNPATDEIVGAFERDAKLLREHLLALSFMRDNDGDAKDPKNWKAYEQVISRENSKAILDGTYQLRNASPQDQERFSKIQKILAQPIYRDTQIYIHPHGIMSLGAAVLDKKSFHYNAQLSFLSLPSSEDTHFERFLQSRVDRCLETQVSSERR